MSCDCLSICKAPNSKLRSDITSDKKYYPILIAQLTSVDNVMLLNYNKTKVGRTMTSTKSHEFPAGTDTHISRQHFSIQYDFDGNFTLFCMSKNGITVDEKFYRKRDQPYILPQHCIIRFPNTAAVLHFRSFIHESSAVPVQPVNNHTNNVTIVSSVSAHETVKSRIRTKIPPYSYSQLIVQAIHESPQKMLPLKKIYSFIMKKYPYYRKFAIKSWQNSIRCNLSQKAYFLKTPHRTGSKIGHFWMIRPSCEARLVSKRFQERVSKTKLTEKNSLAEP